ncbi:MULTISPECIES: Wadjet anti-phage system protein JetD domain-containing protein [Paenibacillus]|uniref:Wadjet anti-phage system protein JetD domain-containing protein n=1 Tax=Paenibacillaceae TaxID=186822 RepID=UPI00048D0D59|nr:MULTISPECIES: Wadjet anti-phage system protein JetD domain-containing protein [Paenibacillus]MBU5445064.1 DUF2399 domain-containing protein [Paenibacillus sp. MSJ-34]MED4600190.1 DUF2220 family protein [Paenibacillus validus]MED4605191.1 DUF2220 family protein [Paenibacillus validus]NTZ17277.1 DUF2399 domain-containing protein [Paenibacillus sp. JMULE4]
MEIHETPYKSKFVSQLLNLLLDKYELSQSFVTGQPSKQRPQLSLNKSPFWQDYTDEMDFRKRIWINEAASELERLGLVELNWARFRTGEQLERIYLRWSELKTAYRVAGRMPKRDKLERLRHILTPLSRHPWEWVRVWSEQADVSLAEGKTAHLEVDDPEGYKDLVCVLLELPRLERAVPIRLLSQKLFKDSKHMERNVQRRLLSLAKQASGEERETEEEWLDFLGVAKNPQIVLVSGPLSFRTTDSRKVDIGVFAGGVGLSDKTVEEMYQVQTVATRIVTIENLATYHLWLEHASELRDTELVLYTGGFPHRSLQSFLCRLAEHLASASEKNIEVYHWGDIDLGGIRIFEYLRKKFFSNLRPMLMDAETLLRYESSAASISDEYAGKLEEALKDTRLTHWRQVLQTMLDRRIRLEQESIVELD